MGYFVAYRHTGESPERLEELIPPVVEALEEKGEDVYCTYMEEQVFQKNGLSAHEIMRHAFEKIEQMGALFVVQDSSEKSEGMLMEVGYCAAKGLRVVVAKRDTVSGSYLSGMADTSFEYSTIKDLQEKIAQLAD